MIKNEIDQLLTKYWEAESTLDEEQQLKEYFATGEVHDDHLPYQEMFKNIADTRSITSRIDVSSIVGSIGASEDKSIAESEYNIDRFLEDYWAGESSLADEEDLRLYFRSGAVAPKHREFKSYFNYLSRESSKSGVNLDVKKILKNDIKPEKREAIVRTLPGRRLRSIAAVGALLIACGVGFFALRELDEGSTKYAGKVTILDEAAEQEEALEITREALAMLSDKFGIGQASIEKEMEQINKLNIFSN